MNSKNVCTRITSERLHQHSTNALGRIYTVHPRNDECFYLRLFLVNVPGPTSFQLLRNCAQHIEKPVNVYIY